MKDELIKQFVEHIAKGCREEQSEDCGVECTYNDACVCWKPILSDLVDIVLAAGYVEVCEDQTLPELWIKNCTKEELIKKMLSRSVDPITGEETVWMKVKTERKVK